MIVCGRCGVFVADDDLHKGWHDGHRSRADHDDRARNCPRCGAQTGRPCTSTAGEPLKQVHHVRKDPV